MDEEKNRDYESDSGQEIEQAVEQDCEPDKVPDDVQNNPNDAQTDQDSEQTDIEVREIINEELGNYFKNLRRERGITAEELCRGICDCEILNDIEEGYLEPDSILQEILRERLGTGNENYESYLDVDDYNRWEARMQILHAIQYEKWLEAQARLEAYRTADYFEAGNPVDVQFVLAMEGQIRRNRGAGREELQEIYRSAICLTVPDAEQRNVSQMVLSLKELSLLLELEQCSEGGGRSGRYLEIMDYVEKYFDILGKAKIYPKAVYFLSRCGAFDSNKAMMQYYDKAVDYLRDASRTYYMWEILKLREELLEQRIAQMKENPVGMHEVLTENLEQNRAWRQVLEQAHDEFGVRRDTFEYCYLYVIKGVQGMNDVVRVRCKMLGMNREVFCKRSDITIRTLQRFENKQTHPRRSTMKNFLEVLKLPLVHTKDELLTDNVQVKQKMKLLKQCVNTGKWREADGLLQEIKAKVSGKNLYNQQVLLQKESQIMWSMGEISKQEYMERMQRALELTLPLERFLQPGVKYVTNQEMTCLVNMFRALEPQDELVPVYASRFEEYYASDAERNLLQTVDGMYAFVMDNVASKLGDRGEYVRAISIDEEMIKEYLHSHRVSILPLAFYDRWWNYTEGGKRGIKLAYNINPEQELVKAIQLANLDKQKRREEFYQQKLKQLYVEL